MKLGLFGAPGVGKGTFAKILCKKLGLHHVSAGNLVRKEIMVQSKLGLSIKAQVERGLLLDDSLITDLVFKELELINEKREGFILDGYPRSLEQALMLASADQDLMIQQVVNIQLDEKIRIEKLRAR